MASLYHFENPSPSLGGQIGAALGTGLGRGLATFAERKLDNVLNRQKEDRLTQEFVRMGMPENQAAFLARQDKETQWQAVRAWWMSQGFDGGDIPATINEQWQTKKSALDQLGSAEQPTEAGPQQGALAAVQDEAQENRAPQGEAMAALAPQAPGASTAPMQSQRKARDLGEAFKQEELRKKGKTPVDLELAELKKEKLRADIEKAKKGPSENKSGDSEKRAQALIDTADEMELTLDELEKLNETKKVVSGFKGRLPTEWQNDETQQFESIANELAGMYARVGGQASAYRIKFSQSMKPNLSQSYETRKKLIEHGRQKSKLLKDKAQARLRGEEMQETKKPGSIVQSLPMTGNTVGDTAFNDETGEKLTWNGTNWV